MEEDKQSIQFYKIKLMEKESEVKTIEAKLKKIQFKHSRDLKEVKIAEQRAKDLLEKEKNKLDKINKQAKEHQQQNSLLHHRLVELKEEKDKEIQNTRNKYNAIKQQVRSYERILPTHTFLTEIGAGIDQLPTYEDIFNNLKQKALSYDNLTTKHQAYKEEMQEKVSNMEKNQQETNKIMTEKDRHIKQILPKVIDLQSQIREYKMQLQEAASKVLDMQDEGLNMKQKIQELQGQNKQLKNEIQQIIQAHNSELNGKQLELRQLTESEFKKYEEEIKQVNDRSQMKEQSLIQQISIYEQQVNDLQTRLAKEKQRHQQNYQQIKEIMQSLKSNLEADKRLILDLQTKNQQLTRNLIKSSETIEEIENKFQLLRKEKHDVQVRLKEEKSQRDLNNYELNQKSIQKKSLQEKLEQMIHEVYRLNDEKRAREQENLHLISELDELKYKAENGNSIERGNRLSIPLNFDQNQQLTRKRTGTNFSIQGANFTSIEGSKNELKLENDSIESRSRKPSVAVSQKMTEINSLKDKIQTMQKELKDKNQQIQQHLKKTVILEEKNIFLEEKTKHLEESLSVEKDKLNTSIAEFSSKIKQIQNAQNRQKEELLSTGKLVKQLQIQLEDLKSNETTFKKKQQASKTSIETLNVQVSNLKAQVKKEKEQKQALTQELKDIRVKQQEEASSNDKNTKQTSEKIKQLNSKINNEEKSKNQLLVKQNRYQAEVAGMKAQIQKLNSKISEADKEIVEKSQLIEQFQKSNKQFKKNIQRLKYEVNQLEQENKQKDREIEMINTSLDRQRKQRTLISVPSLASLQGDQQSQQEQNFKKNYNTIGQKEGQIYMLERQVSNLKEEVQELKITHKAKIQDIQTEQNEYIQEIISMKLKVAESEMRAAQKEHLYNQLKRKVKNAQNNLRQSLSPTTSK